MCGVFGFTGVERDIETTVGSALRALEYRGYDSWGVSWVEDGRLTTRKRTGRLAEGALPVARAEAAIGHTRWATHGGVTDENAHPHCASSGRFSVVHNGIIENADALRRELSRTHRFLSETDSEVVPFLLEDAVRTDVPVEDAVVQTFVRLDGHNAIVVLDTETNRIYAMSSGSPLLVAESELGAFIASDAIAFHRQATAMTPLPERTLARLAPEGVVLKTDDAVEWVRPVMIPVVHRELEDLGGFAHHTLREIAQQPGVISRLLDDRAETMALAAAIRDTRQVVFTGCGSAFFAARFGVSWLSAMAGKAAFAIPSSEFAECMPMLGPETLVIALTQSGETADVIDAIALAQASGARVHAIVNVPYSTVARTVERTYLLHAGVEQSVLATKSFMAKLTRLLLAAGEVAGYRDMVEGDIRKAVSAISHLLDDRDIQARIDDLAARLASHDHVFLIGRGVGYAVAQEAALKLKEGSYVHAEAMAAGELKHGTIALIEDGTPCLIFGSGTGTAAQLANTAQELRARGGLTIGVGGMQGISESASYRETLGVFDCGDADPLVQIALAQVIAYRTALARGVNPDRPRNLAKSVTVR
ncbi:MAG: glutamine--fructose-6-phosphate transaminase (isomerizing) [Thermomicrobiales bacterium]